MIYFDNAASSYPKPQEVIDAVTDALTKYAANPGRGSHKMAEQAASVIKNARIEIARFFGLSNLNNVFFYQNATMALNQAIKGFNFQRGDHVITTSNEHNSVRRPLEAMVQEKGIDVTYLSTESSHFDEEQWRNALRKNTKLIIATHASNVTGLILPIEKIAQFAHEHQIVFLLDASQTAGVLPIDMEKTNIDMLAFPGHISLLGPQGIGALLVRNEVDLYPLIHGGTGNYSEEVSQPNVRPYKFESGTLNTPGIAGLLAGIKKIKQETLEAIYEREIKLTSYCLKKMKNITGLKIYGPLDAKQRVGVIAFSLHGIDSHELALILDQHYEIAVRSGLHCAPTTHKQLGTLENGLVRVSFNFMNTETEIDRLIDALKEITKYYPSVLDY